MKTFLTMLAAMFMTFGVIGCGGGGEDTPEDTGDEAPMTDAETEGHDGTEGGEETPAE